MPRFMPTRRQPRNWQLANNLGVLRLPSQGPAMPTKRKTQLWSKVLRPWPRAAKKRWRIIGQPLPLATVCVKSSRPLSPHRQQPRGSSAWNKMRAMSPPKASRQRSRHRSQAVQQLQRPPTPPQMQGGRGQHRRGNLSGTRHNARKNEQGLTPWRPPSSRSWTMARKVKTTMKPPQDLAVRKVRLATKQTTWTCPRPRLKEALRRKWEV